MPITYQIKNNGHLIHSIAEGIVTSDDFINYEIEHATDEKLKSPVNELFEIKHGAFDNLTESDIHKILERRKNSAQPRRHRCALVLSMSDHKGWDLAKYYEKLVMLHYPASVIVFGDLNTAKIWLGIK